jgi:hypothetical protein
MKHIWGSKHPRRNEKGPALAIARSGPCIDLVYPLWIPSIPSIWSSSELLLLWTRRVDDFHAYQLL